MPVIRYKGVEYGGPTVHIQSDTTATNLEDTMIPNGQTIKSYLNSNRFFKCYWAGETQTVTNGDTIDLSNFGSTDMLYIHFNRYGHQGYVFGFKSGFGGNNGMRILFGNNYFITLTNPNDNLNTLKIQTDSAFPNIVCNIYKLA